MLKSQKVPLDRIHPMIVNRSYNLASFGRWMGKCIITMKKDEGNIFSSWQRVTTIWSSNYWNSLTSITFEHSLLKNAHNLTSTTQTSRCIDFRIAIGWICCIRMWQSCVFNPDIFLSFIWTCLEIFDEYLFVTFSKERTLQNNSLTWGHWKLCSR